MYEALTPAPTPAPTDCNDSNYVCFWQTPMKDMALSSDYDVFPGDLCTCKKRCLAIEGCGAFSMNGAMAECRVPMAPTNGVAVNPNQAPSSGHSLYQITLKSVLYPSECALNYGWEQCKSYAWSKYYYGYEWNDKSCTRIDLKKDQPKEAELYGTAPNRASRFCRTAESLQPGVTYTVPTRCSYSYYCSMNNNISAVSSKGTHTDGKENYSEDASGNEIWDGRFIRYLRHTVMLKKTTLCLDISTIEPAAAGDDMHGNCRSQKQCTLVGLEVNGGANKCGQHYDTACSGAWVEADGFTVKPAYWMALADEYLQRSICSFM